MKKRIFICFLILIFILAFVPSFAEEYTGSALFGRLTLKIPDSGSTVYAYIPQLRNSEGDFVRSNDLLLSVSDLPDGVNFNPSDNSITVFDNAKSGDMFTITTSAPKYPNIKEKSYTVRLTENMLVNTTFSDLPFMSGWDKKSSSYFKTDGSMLKIDLNRENGSTYILTQSEKALLKSDTLYEFSFDIKTSDAKENEDAENHGEIIGSSAVAYVNNPSYPTWTHITIPFRPEDDAEFIISLVISAEDDTSVLIKNPSLTLSVGTLPASLKATYPQAVNVPFTGSVTVPCSISALDIEGNIVPATIYYDITPKSDTIFIDQSSVSVGAETKAGVYKVHAYAAKYPDVYTDFDLVITASGIINGSFEDKGSDSLWFAPGNGEYSVISEIGNSYASFTPNAEIGVMYNNAYVSFSHSESYVFSADLRRKFSDQSAFVTFIVEDSEDPDNLQLCAYFEIDTTWKSYKAVFTPESDLSGRFIVAVNVPDNFDEQTIYLDNIFVEPAVIRADNVKISGSPTRGHTLKGSFDFVNNFDGESASVTNWALSSAANGEYKTLSNSNVDELEVTEDMEGKYLRFEVTPISLTAGIVGETVYSATLKIPKRVSHSGSASRPSDNDEDEPIAPPQPPRDNISFISPIALEKYIGSNIFTDCENHWAKDYINAFCSAGIASGYSKELFMPDKNITRAELCALMMRSLSLEPGSYSGAFEDVSLESWYAGIIQTMQNCGIVKGTGEKLFSPNAPITREQLTVIIMRAYNLLSSDVPSVGAEFSDIDEISPYASEYVKSAYALGIVNGENGFFLPTKNATRAEAVVMLSRFLSVAKK